LLSNVYNQFLCSLTCTNNQYFSRTLEYLAVFNIPITIEKQVTRRDIPGSAMALVHIAGKLKFGAKRKGKKRKKAYLNNWTP
jgi:hypothetical protein